MEARVEELTEKIWRLTFNQYEEKLQTSAKSHRILIGIAGIPGSGKTTLAANVTRLLNQRHRVASPGVAQTQEIAIFVPMDGYHLTRAQLSAMADPAFAHARRGASFTFDGESYAALVRQLSKPLCPETTTILAPSFDHAVKDPIENDIMIPPTARVVAFEGNYVALDREPWREAAGLMDEVWFVEVGINKARERLVKRHVEAGIAEDEEAAGRRADENDLVNGQEILEHRIEVDEVVESVEDREWRPENQPSA